MEGDKSSALKQRPSTEFKRRVANKKGSRGNFSQDYHDNTQVPNPSDTVYRILCPSKKIGGVIGKGGGIIKALREDTKAKINVSDSVPGSDVRVIMIYSPSDKKLKDSDEGHVEQSMIPHCPAQDALMKVHDRIIEEELSGRKKDGPEADSITEVNARLLVPHNMVGCLLGKGGDVIQRLRSETGANVRVLPVEHLPPCALSTDELVLLQGNPMVLKKALYEVSTLLHQNPRKEKAINFGRPLQGSGLHPGGPPLTNLPLAHNSMWFRGNTSHVPPQLGLRDYANNHGFLPGQFDDGPPRPGVENVGEFSMKILCSASKIGGVIGKGGVNVRHLKQETGARIHVEDDSASSEQRVICVSAVETLQNPRSQTIDAILLLQSKVSEVSDKGIITTRLLAPSSKLGCLLGQGGSIITEMRRRTQADIRVCSKDEKPECASPDEELVQVSGSLAVAKDALAEVLSRLRARCLRDTGAVAEQPPHRPIHGSIGNFPQTAPPASGPVAVGNPGGFSTVKGVMHDSNPPSYPSHPSASRYPHPNSVEVNFSSSSITPISGAGGIYSNNHEVPGTRMKPDNPHHGPAEPLIDKRDGSNHFNVAAAAPNIHHYYGRQNNPHQNPYPNLNGQASYHSMAPQQVPSQSPYQNPHQIPYHQSTPAPGAYQY